MKNVSRRSFLKSTIAASLIGMTCSLRKPPNVVFIFTDQQHWHAMGSADPFFNTPHLDALAQASCVFSHSFCTTPQCSPSRSSLFTGYFPHKTKVLGNIGAAGGNNLAHPTMFKKFKQTGYNTAYVGKWHLGDHPIAREGIDYFDDRDPHSGRQGDATSVQKAIQHLSDPDFTDSPFFLTVSLVDPHDIYSFKNHITSPNTQIELPHSWHAETFENKPSIHKQFMLEDQGKQIWNLQQSMWEQYKDCYREKNHIVDSHIGKILETIKEKNLWDDTIIVFTSDHGDMDTFNRLIFKGPFMYDHMVRVPLFIRLPEKYGGENNRHIEHFDASGVDIAPTLMDLCAIEQPNSDGVSLTPFLKNSGIEPSRDFVVSEYYSKQKWVNPIRMLRTRDFKYNHYIEHGEELYDLKNDPEELHNLANLSEFEKHKNELKDMLDEWMIENSDPFYSQIPTDRLGNPLSNIRKIL